MNARLPMFPTLLIAVLAVCPPTWAQSDAPPRPRTGDRDDAPPPPPPPPPPRDHELGRENGGSREGGPRGRRGGSGGDRMWLRGEDMARVVTYLGIVSESATEALRAQLGLPEGIGLVVLHVESGSPAEKAGLQKFDVIHKVDDQLIMNQEQFRSLIQTHKTGESITLNIIRKGQPQTVKAELGTTTEQPPMFMQYFGAPNMDRINQLVDEARDKLKSAGDKGAKEAEEMLDKLARELRDKRQQWFNRPPPPPGAPGTPGTPGFDGPPGMRDFGPEGRPPRDGEGNFRRGPRDGEGGERRGPRDGEGGPRPRGGDGERGGERGQAAPNATFSAHATASASYSDGTHNLTLTVEDGKRSLKATDKDGKVLFDGPVNTPDERRDIPAEIRPKLEKLESQTRINMRIQGEPPRPRNGGEGDRPRRGPDADDRRPS